MGPGRKTEFDRRVVTTTRARVATPVLFARGRAGHGARRGRPCWWPRAVIPSPTSSSVPSGRSGPQPRTPEKVIGPRALALRRTLGRPRRGQAARQRQRLGSVMIRTAGKQASPRRPRSTGLREVTDRDAVLKALAEFDELGREQFLKKYGFRRSRAFYVRHDDRLYD